MDDFRRQYSEELAYQEIKSNKHTLKCFFWFLIAVAFIWLLTVIGFFEVDKKLITIAFVSNIILFIPAVYISVKSDLSKLWIKYFLLSLICVVTAVITAFLSFHAVLIYVVPLLLAIQYRRRATIWFVYVLNTVTMLISSLASFYYGLCDLNLLLQSQHVRNWYLEIVTEGTLSLPFNENPVFIIIVFEVFPRSIILFVFSIMLQYTIVSSNEDAYRIAQLTYLKETDTRTRVFNKNKYTEMAAGYYPKLERIAVLFWDLNNLKVINDKYGHAVGDKVIEKFSSELYLHADDRRRVYRIGGDEFLLIIDGPEQDEAENVIRSVRGRLAAYNADNEIKISSAVGLAAGCGSDILEVVKMADARMYENKKRSKESRRS
ncbi:MAG: GGDEF domain-containing protein [Ruminococcus sp.]|nr:GGDEF domain-containing protein [Ruminococcus sp.]